jgi:hypothetical protein
VSRCTEWGTVSCMGSLRIHESDVVLSDGSVHQHREHQPEDVEAIQDHLQSLCQRSRTFRFLSAGVDLSEAAQLLGRVGGVNAAGLLAIQGQPPRVVGHGIFQRTGPNRAQAAITVSDSLHGKGVATIRWGHLA